MPSGFCLEPAERKTICTRQLLRGADGVSRWVAGELRQTSAVFPFFSITRKHAHALVFSGTGGTLVCGRYGKKGLRNGRA
jgi:hypothetical protein